ncbi:MAG: hypothetical protein GY783_00865 [Gammaproteobacteria bacterium]|nr:hypothetical protein [Gammaproteobacteria bacterium]
MRHDDILSSVILYGAIKENLVETADKSAWQSIVADADLTDRAIAAALRWWPEFADPGGRPTKVSLDRFVAGLCDIFADCTGRDLGLSRASTGQEQGSPTGPLFRFVEACVIPLFAVDQGSADPQNATNELEGGTRAKPTASITAETLVHMIRKGISRLNS